MSLKSFLAIAFLLVALPVGAQTATVTWGTTNQTMDGFGGEDWNSAQSLTTAQANTFFSPTSGIGLEFIRTGNYACPNTGACTVSTSNVPDLTSLQNAVTAGAKIELSIQSPSASLKYSGTFDSGVAGASGACLATTNFSAYATYMVQWIQMLNSNSAPVSYLDVANEAENNDVPTSSLGACDWTGATLDTFIGTYLGPAMNSAGLLSSVQIIMPSSSQWFGNVTDISSTCLNDSTCAQYVSIASAHGYGNGSYYDTGYCCALVSSPGSPATNKKIWQSEINGGFTYNATEGLWNWDASIADGLEAAKLINDYLVNANVTGWEWWQLADCCSSGPWNDGLMLSDLVTTSKRMFVVGNWSKFVRTGYVRIAATNNPQSGVYVTAFKSGNNLVVVVLNQNSSSTSQTFSLSGAPTFGSVTPNVTSSSLNLVAQGAVSVSAGSWTYSLPASSVTTFVGLSGGGGGTTYYVDYSTGNDANTGLNTSVPWKHAPGMLGLTPSGASTGDGCTSVCASTTISAGTNIILKGGTVWPYTTMPWVFTSSGTSSSQTYGCIGSGCIYIGNAVGAGLPAWNNGTVTAITFSQTALVDDYGGWNPASPPTISCSGGGGSGAAATPHVMSASETNDATNIGGFIYHIALTNAGSSYTSAPACSLAGSGAGASIAADINRAIIDFGATQGSPPDWPQGQCASYSTTCLPFGVTGSYVLMSGLEVRNEMVQEPLSGGSNGLDYGLVNLLASDDTFTNFYVHGMSLDCRVVAGVCTPGSETNSFPGIFMGSPYDEASNGLLENGDTGYLGTSTQAANGICTTNYWCTDFEFGFQSTIQGGFGPLSVHGNKVWADFWQLRFFGSDASGSDPFLDYGNELWLTSYGTNPGVHENARYEQITGGTMISWNNLIHNQVFGTSSQFQCPSGVTYDFYNEVTWGIGTGTQPYSADIADTGGAGGCIMNLYNDTMYASNGGTCVNSQTGTNTTNIVMQNLQCIQTPSISTPFWGTATNTTFKNYSGSTTQATVQASSVVQSITTANGQGYVATNAYAPTSSGNDTVTFSSSANQENLTSLCSGNFAALCLDIKGNARPSTGGWNAGAYEFGGGGSTVPPAPVIKLLGIFQ